MTEHDHDDLARDLAALGRAVDVPRPGPGFAVGILERLPEARQTRWAPARGRSRWTAVAVAAAAAVAVGLLALTPPVRAAVADWFGFGGVRVERGDPGPPPTAAASPPVVRPGGSLADAAASVRFTVSAPVALGEPDGVEVSEDRRMVSMSWETTDEGVLRVDEFDATLDWSVLKVATDVRWAAVDGIDALWFEEPHEVALLEPDGTQVTHSARLAGHTLIWMADGVTFRLEGDVGLARAVEIAESTVPVE